MEEILASIRRIISSDDDAPATGGKSAAGDTDTQPEPSTGAEAEGKPAGAPGRSSEITGKQETPPTGSMPQPEAQEGTRAGTLAGLAQQLRGTRGMETPEGGREPDAVSAETPPIAPTGSDEVVRTGDADEPPTPPKVAPASSAQSLADLAKSINQKIGAAASRENVAAPKSPDHAGSVIEAAASEEPADMPAAAAKAETPASGSLRDLAESLQSYVDESGPAATMAEHNASGDDGASGLLELENELAGELETLPDADSGYELFAGESPLEERREREPDAVPATSETGKAEPESASPAQTSAARGADKPEAFKEALVSPATRQAVSSSIDRLKQATAELSQAQVETVLRPLLKEWLDNNLPAVVERMVQQEIDQITSQAGNGAEEDLPQSKSA